MFRIISLYKRNLRTLLSGFGFLIGVCIWQTGITVEPTNSRLIMSDYRDHTDLVTPAITSQSTQAQLKSTLSGLPLLFVENRGLLPDAVAYTMQGGKKHFFFTPDGVTISIIKPVQANTTNPDGNLIKASLSSALKRWSIKLNFIEANSNVQPIGENLQSAVINYFKGSKEDWKTGLRTYSTIRYPNLWPGIDLVYNGSINKLKYHFVVQPGADPKQIQLAYRGVTGMTITDTGTLNVTTPVGDLNDDRPVAYQTTDGQQVEVAANYVLTDNEADSRLYGFSLGSYDPTLPLVIDPSMLVYAGFIGGNQTDVATDIAVDTEGYAYVVGYTSSSEATFPTTVGPDLTKNGNHLDAFVAKVAKDGSQLIYAGYVGGDGRDYGWGIAVDGMGNAYITGQTTGHFPVLVGPDLSYNSGNYDAFVVKVSADGTNLEYAGYIGGGSADRGFDIAVDALGRAYVTGDTWSHEAWNFPVTVGPDLTYNKGVDAFVARVAANGRSLEYAGYIGGVYLDRGNGIAVDQLGRAYVTGYTTSTNTFPVNVGPNLTHSGGDDAFVARVSPDGTWLEYAGYIGGTASDIGRDIAVDDLGNAYVTGTTLSTETSFPVNIGPDITYNGGKGDAFVSKVSMDGARLDYSGYIGGNLEDQGTGIAVDQHGNAYITGYTNSYDTTFPVILGPDQTINGSFDAFVARLTVDGASLDYSGYIGGQGADISYGIGLDLQGNAYVAGYTYSNETTFPVTVGPDLTHNGGKIDAFVAKVDNPFDDEQVSVCSVKE